MSFPTQAWDAGRSAPPTGEKTQAYGGPAVGLPHELDSLGSVGERTMDFLPPLQQAGHRKRLLNGNRFVRELRPIGLRAKRRAGDGIQNNTAGISNGR